MKASIGRLSPMIGLETSFEVAKWWQKQKRERIRSLGENLPWRHPGKEIKVKTSLRHPSCLKNTHTHTHTHRKIEKRRKMKLTFKMHCRLQVDHRKQEKMPQSLFHLLHTLLNHFWPFFHLTVCFFKHCVSYKRPCVFYKRLL